MKKFKYSIVLLTVSLMMIACGKKDDATKTDFNDNWTQGEETETSDTEDKENIKLVQDKKVIVVINKTDAIDPDVLTERLGEFKKSFGRKKKPQIVTISAAGRIGIAELISVIEKQFLDLVPDQK